MKNAHALYDETVPERFEDGSHLLIVEDDASPVLHRVMRRVRGGYLVKSPREKDASPLTNSQINDLRLALRLSYHPADIDIDPDHISRVLMRTFEAFKPELKLMALRRCEYCRAVSGRHKEGLTLEECFNAVPTEVFERHRGEWEREDYELQAARAEAARKRRRNPKVPTEKKKLAPPSPRTLETWYGLWVSHGCDVRVLIPDFSGRGDHTPRYKDQWIYEEMRRCLETFYLIKLAPTLRYAYEKFEDECEKRGLAEGSYPTYQAFRNFKKGMVDDYEEFNRRNNSRRAYLEFNVFKRRESPGKVLEEVEIDHCLIDLIVVDEDSGNPIGRPWFTAIVDRASRMLLGGHLSFEVPSYAVVQRCLAHACWPKNLAGLDLVNPWPCKGIPEIIFTDNGKEFHSKSLKATEKALNTFIRPLPVMSPWLKGTVERLFGTMHVRVYGHKEGKTFSNSIKRGDYKSAKHAKTTLPELREMLVRWIVDDYHTKEHAGLGGVSPIERWSELIKQNRPVTPPPDFDKLIEMTGEVVYKPVQKDGIHYLGLTWWAKEFTDLRKRRGGRVRHFQVRFDPFDLYEIRVLDEDSGRYIHAECTNKELSMHVSRFAAKQHLTEAQRSGDEGFVSEGDLEKAKSRVEQSAAKRLSGAGKIRGAQRAARYRNFNGIYLTPMAPEQTPSIPSTDIADTTHQESRVSADEASLSPKLPSEAGEQDAPMTTPANSLVPAEVAALVPEDAPAQDNVSPAAETAGKNTINDLVKAKMEEWR